MSARVYLAYDAEGDLLYVGHTKLPMETRMACHRSTADWPADVARLDVLEYDDIHLARREERNFIADLEPLHNIQGNPRHNPEWYEVDLPETPEMYAEFMRGVA